MFHGVGVVNAVAVPISLYFEIDVQPLVLHVEDDIQDVPECSGVRSGAILAALRRFLFCFASSTFSFSSLILSFPLTLVLCRGRKSRTSGKVFRMAAA